MKIKNFFLNITAAVLLPLFLFGGCRAAKERSGLVPVNGPALPESFSRRGEEQTPPAFWEEFQDQRLNTLVKRALAGNFNLKSAWNRLEQYQALARKYAAEQKPSVSFSAEAERARSGGNTSSSSAVSGRSFSLGLAAGYELDLWGRLRGAAQAARFDAGQREQDLRTAAITLAAEVCETWVALAHNCRQAELLKEQINTDEQYLEAVKARKYLRAGTRVEDLLLQEQRLEAKRGELVRLKQEEAVLTNSLAVLLGVSAPDWNVPESGDFPQLAALPDTGVPAQLLRNRPDVLAAELRVLAADARLQSAFAGRFPRISISGRLSTADSNISGLFDNWFSVLAANLLQPVFDANRREAEIERTRAVTQEALNDYRQKMLEALKEVEDALSREAGQAEFIESLNAQLALSENAARQTLTRYLNGGADYLRVLEAQGAFQGLQREYFSARYQHLRFRLQLYRALAGGWDMEEDVVIREPAESPAGEYTGKQTVPEDGILEDQTSEIKY